MYNVACDCILTFVINVCVYTNIQIWRQNNNYALRYELVIWLRRENSCRIHKWYWKWCQRNAETVMHGYTLSSYWRKLSTYTIHLNYIYFSPIDENVLTVCYCIWRDCLKQSWYFSFCPIKQVSPRNLYITDESNTRLFPVSSGFFAPIHLINGGHYEVHGDPDQSPLPASRAIPTPNSWFGTPGARASKFPVKSSHHSMNIWKVTS